MKVLGSPGSPFVRKVRVIAAEKNIPIEYVVERPNVEGSRIPDLNPLGKIPVLLLDDGEALYDSVVIGEYLDGLKAEPRLVPADFAGRIAVKRLEALGDGLAEIAVTISHDYGPMNDPEKRAGWMPRQYDKLKRTLGFLQRSIEGRSWLHGDRFGLADICAGYALFYLDQVVADVAWRRSHPGLAAYAERLAARGSFRSTVPAQN
ncbi:MAG: glutathione S-transferase N-terminal domain-containing protein [Burkholderiales bacterium]|nr:glutathione S-transferase N-terminal domain-containing protein [Burkholderiales bacterium]